eukprot:s8374_g1.t1
MPGLIDRNDIPSASTFEQLTKPKKTPGWEALVVLAAAFRKAAEQKAQRTSRRLTELRLRGLREGSEAADDRHGAVREGGEEP